MVTVFKKGTAARSIALNKTKLTLMKGKSQTLKIKRIRPLGASSRVKWTSSNKKVAVVNSKGKAVSYTHLDVYKRQLFMESICPIMIH